MSEKTPLMKQYNEIKSQYNDAILFFRVGDFYETFYDDAKIASKELGITLTRRNKEKGVDIPLAGVPFHSVSSYIAKLVNKGYKVAICDQVENPKDANGIVKREVTKIITPGTVIDTDFLDENKNNYLLCLVINKKNLEAAISYVDITTSDFFVEYINAKNEDELVSKILGEINKISPNEILFDKGVYEFFYNEIVQYVINLGIRINEVSKIRGAKEFLKNYFGVISLDVYGIEQDITVDSCAEILNFVIDMQKSNDKIFRKISYNRLENFMELNLTTQNNLDLFPKNNSDKRATLLGVIDNCMTSMGSRFLKSIIKNPLMNKEEIIHRHKYIDYFFNNVILREEIRNILKDIYDVERIIGKLVLGTVNGKDLIALKESIEKSVKIKNIFTENIFDIDIVLISKIYRIIDSTIKDDAPFSVREGGIIKDNVSQELDSLRNISKMGKNYILDLENREREKTGIKGLKIKYNKVFGYFIEITNANKDLVPESYIRRQTLTNCERYIISELKEYEDKIIGAKTKIEILEYELFKEIVNKILEHKEELFNLVEKLSFLDVITNFAHVSVKNNYVKPEIVDGFNLSIVGARHPIVESLITSGTYIENDIKFNEKQKLIILTGPNMSGKSTYMKQIALNIIMAQIGCFVPAKSAKIPIVDKIFTRVGASDDLLTGQSTFMLEMSEVANIVNNATKKSFIILDEVGRGTSTYDGISIATSITEYIHDNIGAKTIFATHYHELTELEKELETAVNFRVEVKENGKEVIFLRKIVEGGADRSYGIEVAKISGIPKEILERSRKILTKLEKRKSIIESKIQIEQMLLFSEFSEDEDREDFYEEENKFEKEVLEELKNIDTDNMSPIDALLKINEIKKKLNEDFNNGGN